jgi:hypothetical protein
VKELSIAYRAKRPGAKVAALASASNYRGPVAERVLPAEDALAWVKGGAVDELVLSCPAGRSDSKEGYADYHSELGNHSALPLSVLLHLRLGGPFVKPNDTLKGLRGSIVTSVLLRVDRSDDLDLAGRYFKSALPIVESILPRPDLQTLEDDVRLKKLMSFELKNPLADQVLAALHEATDVSLVRDPDLRVNDPVFGTLACVNKSAYEVMQQLALSKNVNGRWEKKNDGYRLTGRPMLQATNNTDPKVPIESGWPGVLAWTGSLLILICVILGWRYWKKCTTVAGVSTTQPRSGGGHSSA